ncbi:MAG TPA: FAD-binding and (Fe-S)-binding domain-containing protein, partial [Thermoanaerobaculia bacterium]|nr:FAD-binding and (Fe-S)-binding domain-containing protein [Thermoanaerobaculia bacterium]
MDARGLQEKLKNAIRGEVRFDAKARALYSTDASNYRQVPIGVVLPRDRDDVLEILRLCREFGAPVLSRGGGTSLAGQSCNVAVVLDMSRHFNRILEVDPAGFARVEPGVILDDLRRAAQPHGLTFGPDPATHEHCTLGGMIGNDSCGVHSVMAALEGEGPRTADQIVELDVVTGDGLRVRVGKTSEEDLARIISEGGRRGQIYADLRALRDECGDLIRARFPDIPRRVSGYNLPYLLPENGFHAARALVGSEGTCVTVLEATVRLIRNPKARSLLVAGFDDVASAADYVMAVLAHRPIGLEGFDHRLVEDAKAIGLHSGDPDLLPPGRGWLLIEFGGDSKAESDEKARRLAKELDGRAAGSRLYEDPAVERQIWQVRQSAVGATAHVPGKPLTWEGWEDSAVPPEKLGGYLRDLRKLYGKHGYEGDFYGHFGQGCVHTRINFDLQTREGVARFRAFLDEAADLVVSYGGSLSGEHGDGQARAELLPKMFGPELVAAFRRFKRIWDPEGRMNPGKVVDPRSITEDLRLTAGREAAPLATAFAYRDDGGSFTRALLRCVGMGKCRRPSGGTMCPSYMVTREEEHSTRGRARLLFEMLAGETITGGWRSKEVYQALDLCLACKGCKSDCPVGVDMATYKAEFLSHYWKGKLRPRSAYAFGLVPWWARAAALAPRVGNFLTQTPGFASLARAAAGIAPRRQIPLFSNQTFRAWFESRGPSLPSPESRPSVLLFPDTFNNFFRPGSAQAAVDVLEAAGFRVTIPRSVLCCGRPLYDYGMLDLARRFLKGLLDGLRGEIRGGTPIVVLEPSCAAVFRDELPGLLPGDEDARRLSENTCVLAEFLRRYAPQFRPPALSRQAILQGHCHQRAIMKMTDEEDLLRRIGLEIAPLDPGCCGMAGAFGFERKHYDVSIRCGERALLPAVRRASPETLVIADGFSCREQIRQATGREALHLAEVLRMALDE